MDLNATMRANTLLQTYTPNQLATTGSQPWSLPVFILVIIFATMGSLMNGYIVILNLRRYGNTMFVFIGLSDLMITLVIMPVSSTIYFLGLEKLIQFCILLQIMCESAISCYTYFFVIMAIGQNYRVRRLRQFFTSKYMAETATAVIAFSIVTSVIGVFFQFDSDFCDRREQGNIHYRAITTVVFFLIPSAVTVYCQWSTMTRLRELRFVIGRSRRRYMREYTTVQIHLFTFLPHLISWLPYLILEYVFPGTDGLLYNVFIWLGVCRSALSCYIYIFCTKATRRRVFSMTDV